MKKTAIAKKNDADLLKLKDNNELVKILVYEIFELKKQVQELNNNLIEYRKQPKAVNIKIKNCQIIKTGNNSLNGSLLTIDKSKLINVMADGDQVNSIGNGSSIDYYNQR